VGGAAGLVVAAYLILVVINWSDQAPSETTISFSSLFENRPSPAESNNAYTYMLGFAAPPDADPYELGLRRRAWIARAFFSSGLDIGPDPLNAHNYRSDRSARETGLAESCNREFFEGCIEALIESESVVNQWLDSEAWLLERYIDMTRLTGYRETPFDHSLPLPPYSDISDIRRLLFIRVWVAGESGDSDLVESLLLQDLVFWRMVLAESDTLISKMIATDLVISHFMMANLVVGYHQRRGLNVRMPSSWLMEISDAERSMQRSLIGEWVLADRTLKRTFDDAQVGDVGVWDYVVWKAVMPFWQPQDLSNRHAAVMAHYIDLFVAPYESIPDALGMTSKFDLFAALNDSISDSASAVRPVPVPYPRPFSRPYNLTGDYVFRGVHPDLSSWGVRVADVEGVRRAAVAAWQLREEGAGSDDIELRLRERQWANPYTDAPLEWDSATSEVVFQGLRSRNRGRYAFPF
jgi:hypothetical protein